MTFAPLAAYSASRNPAATPAPASTITSMPAFARLGMTMGTSATRRSPGYVSRGTPTIIQLPPSSPLQHNAALHAYSTIRNVRLNLPKPSSRIFFERATPGKNRFHVAARAGHKLWALGAIATKPSLYLYLNHTLKHRFYMQIRESPIEPRKENRPVSKRAGRTIELLVQSITAHANRPSCLLM